MVLTFVFQPHQRESPCSAGVLRVFSQTQQPRAAQIEALQVDFA